MSIKVPVLSLVPLAWVADGSAHTDGLLGPRRHVVRPTSLKYASVLNSAVVISFDASNAILSGRILRVVILDNIHRYSN